MQIPPDSGQQILPWLSSILNPSTFFTCLGILSSCPLIMRRLTRPSLPPYFVRIVWLLSCLLLPLPPPLPLVLSSTALPLNVPPPQVTPATPPLSAAPKTTVRGPCCFCLYWGSRLHCPHHCPSFMALKTIGLRPSSCATALMSADGRMGGCGFYLCLPPQR
jgi:hypothetical protein